MIIFPGATSAPSNEKTGTILADGQEVGVTVQCCHCGKHYLWVKGSGQWRSTCTICNRHTCGDPGCVKPLIHIPWIEKLELHRRDPKKYKLD